MIYKQDTSNNYNNYIIYTKKNEIIHSISSKTKLKHKNKLIKTNIIYKLFLYTLYSGGVENMNKNI